VDDILATLIELFSASDLKEDPKAGTILFPYGRTPPTSPSPSMPRLTFGMVRSGNEDNFLILDLTTGYQLDGG
jgi:hypothetical protein